MIWLSESPCSIGTFLRNISERATGNDLNTDLGILIHTVSLTAHTSADRFDPNKAEISPNISPFLRCIISVSEPLI